MGIIASLLDMALQSRPAYACSCIPAAIHHAPGVPDHVDTSITDSWVGLLGSKHEDTIREMAWHHSATKMLVRTPSWYYSSKYSIPSPINLHHQQHPNPPQPPHARTRPKKEIPISPAPESLNSTPMNALIRSSAREPSDVDCILKRRQHSARLS
jgi:hypothetical protein